MRPGRNLSGPATAPARPRHAAGPLPARTAPHAPHAARGGAAAPGPTGPSRADHPDAGPPLQGPSIRGETAPGAPLQRPTLPDATAPAAGGTGHPATIPPALRPAGRAGAARPRHRARLPALLSGILLALLPPATGVAGDGARIAATGMAAEPATDATGPGPGGDTTAMAADPWARLAADPRLFRQELRRFLLEEPGIIARSRAEARRRMAADAASDLADEIAGDSAAIAAHSGALFGVTARGFGASDGPAAITLFTRAGCAACRRAEEELRALAADMPGLRVELRSAADTLPDRLDLALARAEGADAAARFRAALARDPRADPIALLSRLGHDGPALAARADAPALRQAIAGQATLFARLDFDTAPSYVMADRLIRGPMPAVVLRRYLRE